MALLQEVRIRLVIALRKLGLIPTYQWVKLEIERARRKRVFVPKPIPDNAHVLIVCAYYEHPDWVRSMIESVRVQSFSTWTLVMVDDSHAVGFVGAHGRGTHEYHQVMDRVDIITGTLGKAMGGASGGFTSAKKEVIDWLRQRSRPYLFSNSLAPAIVSASLKVLELLAEGDALRKQLWDNVAYFRREMSAAGFSLAGADHAIIPVMLGDAKLASTFADKLLERGIYVIGFSFPVVPKGQARIRTQISAAHTPEQLEQAVKAFTEVGKELGVI